MLTRSKFYARPLIMLLIACVVLCAADKAEAGCHYGEHDSAMQSREGTNPREHARSFKFLGQWVYERGEIKYEPWQHELPCDGPLCKAPKNKPVSTNVELVPVRGVSLLCLGERTDLKLFILAAGNIDLLDVSSFSIYHAVILKPPRA